MESKYVTKDAIDFPVLRKLDAFMIGHKGFICGGCFKNLFEHTDFKDVDIFFESYSDYKDATDWFAQNEDFIGYYSNDNVMAFKHSSGMVVELIRKEFGTPEEILDSFDFTVVKFAYVKHEHGDSVGYEALYHPDFFEHLYLKRLVIDDKIPFPASTLERSYKYGRYGYYPCRETKLKLIEALRELPDEEDVELSNSMYDGWD